MKRARLIYNPFSGKRVFGNRLDLVIHRLQLSGYEVTPIRTTEVQHIYDCMEYAKGYDCIITSGGDGTLNHVVNAMLKKKINLPIGILPSGTSNDFAKYLNIPMQTSNACDVIAKNKLQEIDIGIINDRYFINVAAAGLLTDVSQKIDLNLKSTLGKMAYYIKGIEQIPNFKPINMKLHFDGKVIEEQIYFFVILNGSSAGGFKLAPDATACDSTLNFVAIKECGIVELLNLFIGILRGEHRDSNNVIYLEGKDFYIECDEKIETDIDGEIGPKFPMKVSLAKEKVKIFIP